ncbi:MAG: hypothetical protein KDJ90_00550 [Nitratireductor sp.]|nr:hypothetical protein [Nitratireductor sp.]
MNAPVHDIGARFAEAFRDHFDRVRDSRQRAKRQMVHEAVLYPEIFRSRLARVANAGCASPLEIDKLLSLAVERLRKQRNMARKFRLTGEPPHRSYDSNLHIALKECVLTARYLRRYGAMLTTRGRANA